VLRCTKKSRTSKFRIKGRPKIGPGKVGPLITVKAFSEPVSRDRYEGALDDINKWRERNKLSALAGEHLKECEQDVISAVRSVEYYKQWAPHVMTPKNYKRIVKADAKKLRAVRPVGTQLLGRKCIALPARACFAGGLFAVRLGATASGLPGIACRS
jgi:hypothetical protein